jgi:Leucine-rich repeat (LRR) protein
MGLTGPIPESIGNLGNLEDIRMQGNALTGPIPESMADLNGLELLNLSANQLTGTIPDGTCISFGSILRHTVSAL